MAKGPKIFLAHAFEDKDSVRKLYEELRELGFRPWLAMENLLPGKSWYLEILKAIGKSDFFIACLSECSIRKQGYMQKEFRTALDVCAEKLFKGICFVPLKFDDCDLPAARLFHPSVNLLDIQWVDYWKPDGLVRLLEVIGNKKENGTGLFQRIQTNGLGMKFIYIPPGEFRMGSPAGKKDADDDEIQHKVTLTQGVYLQATQVTQVQWQKVMGNNPSYFKTYRKDLPVESVSWDDVQTFIEKLNQSEDDFQYRLPTEAEWEYSARAGSNAEFYFGAAHEDLKGYAWFYDNSNGTTHPVAKKKPNKWGLYDMYGNVWEWCQDCYEPYEVSDVINPCGLSSGLTRVIRGGSWSSIAEFCRSASRDGFVPSTRNDGLGFRLARVKA